ncbi:MAG: ATP-binding cassette domain-containing protein [Pseudobacter sp.]|uniref:ATP-binding cassette domain-containing protein n=1 Tax=Pseudobacter sp. TaxID=2045420 RepID=UPI003F7D3373
MGKQLLPVRHIIRLLQPREQRQWLLLLLADLCISLLDIAALALLLALVDLYANATGIHFLHFSWWDARTAWPLLLVLLIFSVKALAGFLVYRSQSRFTGKVATRISGAHLQEFLSGPFTRYSRPDTAGLMRRISHSPIDFCQHVLGSCNQLFTQGVLVLGTLAAISWYNILLLPLLCLLLLPPALLLYRVVKKRMQDLRAAAKKEIDLALQYLQETLNGYVDANIYEAGPVLHARYLQQQQRFNRNVSGILTVQGIPPRVIELAALTGITLVILLLQLHSKPAQQTIITLGAFLAAAYRIIPGLVKILQSASELHSWKYTIDELQPAAPILLTEGEDISPVQSIRFTDVYFGYNAALVLKNINLHFEAGTITGITGLSGKGKTSLLQMLPGFTEPVSGSILLNESVSDIQQRKQLRSRIAYVPQQPFLLHDTLLFNITFSPHNYDEERLQKAIRLSGLQSLVESHPEGIHFILEEQGRNLSGGQRKRVALARAFYKEASILLLDEALNELDFQSTTLLMFQLREAAEAGQMIIIVSHHQHILDHCHKIFSIGPASTRYHHHHYPGISPQ